MIDRKGYRLNVGIVLVNQEGKLFWGKRAGQSGWQFPQGGLNDYETVEEAMYRELKEEVGLEPDDVEILGVTRRWLYYRLPYKMRRHRQKPYCIGQRQKWFLLLLKSPEERIQFDHTETPEFDGWKWVDSKTSIEEVIAFKREVYEAALKEFEPLLPKG